MGQFKPMVKMYTTEPTVELKLKKGGHVNMKKGGHAKQEKETGHKSMHMMDGGVMGALASTPALVGRPAVNAPVRTPGKPPMAMRRKAMAPVRPAAGMMKKGGKAEGGESMAEHKSEMKAIKGLKSELKSHESKPASKGHKGLKSGGAAGDAAQTKTTVKGNAGAYSETMMHGTPKGKTNGTTGSVKESNAGGYKRGGGIRKATGGAIPDETTSGSPATTIMHEAKPGREQGPTGGVRMSNAGGFKKGGKAYAKGGNVSRYVTDNVVGTPPGVTNTKTGSVREGNAGGYKKGGSTKKAFATGGIVDSGRPVAMPQGRKPASKPVSNDRQSGTFKRGGLAEGGKLEDLSKGAYDKSIGPSPEEMDIARSIRGLPRAAYDQIRRAAKSMPIFSGQPETGSVTKTKESVTVSPGKKRGGRC